MNLRRAPHSREEAWKERGPELKRREEEEGTYTRIKKGKSSPAVGSRPITGTLQDSHD